MEDIYGNQWIIGPSAVYFNLHQLTSISHVPSVSETHGASGCKTYPLLLLSPISVFHIPAFSEALSNPTYYSSH